MESRRGMGIAAVTGAAAYLGWRTVRRFMQADLAGRVVLITGGSRGLGLALAREMGAHGCKLAICARDDYELWRARKDLQARGFEVKTEVCDVSDREAVARMVSSVSEHYGAIDILINNAGIIQVGPMEAMALPDYEQAMAVNFWGAVYTTMAVLPQMRARGGGKIVNITSIGGKVAVPHLLPYDCAKFAFLGFSEGLHAELAKDGIVVTTVVPGLMRTGSPVNAIFKGKRADEFTWFGLGDATSVTSMSADRAARRIVTAVRRGEGEITLSWQAKMLRLAHDLFPSLMTDVLGVVNRMLPRADEIDPGHSTGLEIEQASWRLTTIIEKAAKAYNQHNGPSVSPAYLNRREPTGD